MPAKTTAAPDSPPPEGVRLRTFRMPYHIVESNSSGFAIGSLLEGGQVSGSVEWIVARPEGVHVGIRNGDRLGRMVFTPMGYGVFEEART